MSNFIWIGDVQKHGAVVIKWWQICKPVEEGGLGVRSLWDFNIACLAKLAFELLKGKKAWAVFMKGRFFRKGEPIT